MEAVGSERLNILTLDGGGIRGLSSLLILRGLMEYINANIEESRPDGNPHRVVEPHEIFDLVAGTSTGGLIAIMLGKLGMSLHDCIEAYYNLSTTIFGKRHYRGIVTRGLAPSKFSGSHMHGCVCRLLQRRGLSTELRMSFVAGIDTIGCAVVCREHENESRYSDLKPQAVRICSLPFCPEPLDCRVSEAARATSAAPTYFRAQKIEGRNFVDGGMEFNNPTETIWSHYSEEKRKAEARRTSAATEEVPHVLTHGTLDFYKVRFVNLGTGTQPDGSRARQPGTFANVIPSAIRYASFLKRQLKQIATDSENIASHMRSLAAVSHGDIIYERFSADNGVCYIEMHKFKKLRKIEQLTLGYLSTPEVRTELIRVAKDLAGDYLLTHQPSSPRSPTDLPHNPGVPAQIPDLDIPAQGSGPLMPETLPSIANTQLNLSLPTNISDASNSTAATDISAEPADPAHILTQAVPPREAPNITGPADSMINPAETADTAVPVRS